MGNFVFGKSSVLSYGPYSPRQGCSRWPMTEERWCDYREEGDIKEGKKINIVGQWHFIDKTFLDTCWSRLCCERRTLLSTRAVPSRRSCPTPALTVLFCSMVLPSLRFQNWFFRKLFQTETELRLSSVTKSTWRTNIALPSTVAARLPTSMRNVQEVYIYSLTIFAPPLPPPFQIFHFKNVQSNAVRFLHFRC